MGTLTKTLTIHCAHQLKLKYKSLCNSQHGHSYFITVQISGLLDKNGMIIDTSKIKEFFKAYDHTNLNKSTKLGYQTTMENLCHYWGMKLKKIVGKKYYQVWLEVSETATSKYSSYF